MASVLGTTILNSILFSVNDSMNMISPEQNFVPNSSLTENCVKVRFSKANNSEDSVSAAVERYAQEFKFTIILLTFLIGVPANIINMAVFCKQGLKDRVNLCLFSLSLTDGLFLIASFTLNCESIYLYLTTGKLKAHWNASMVNSNLVCLFCTGFISIILSTIIACERCYCVMYPLKYSTLMRTRTMASIIVSVYVFVFGSYFIVAYRFRVGCIYDPVTGAVVTTLIEGEFFKAHRKLIDGLTGYLFGAVISGGVMTVVITATIITTVKLRQLTTWRSEASSSSSSSSSLSSRDMALTKMLIGNSVFFILFASPKCVFRVVWLFFPELSAGGRYHHDYIVTLSILEGFCCINYTFNFVVYYVMGSRYRETFWALFGRSGKQKKCNK